MTYQGYGMTIPFDGVPLHEHAYWFKELADLGYTDVWSSEASGEEPGLRSVATAIGTPPARRAAMGGSWLSRRV